MEKMEESTADATRQATTAPIRFCGFELDLQRGELRDPGGRKLPVQPQPLKVLALLAGEPGRLFTREEIQEQVWGKDVFVDFEHGLNFSIRQLRSALGDDPKTPRFIETVPRKGYCFIAQVEGQSNRSRPAAAGGAATSRLRTLAYALAAGIVFTAGAALLAFRHEAHPPAASAAPRLVVAVLPFRLIGQGENDFLADALTEETISQLGRLQPQHIAVIARTSALAYKGGQKKISEVAGELHATHVVEGTVRREGSQVSVAARLVDARDQAVLWSSSFQSEVRGVLGPDARLAQQIGRALAVQLVPIRNEAIARQDAPNNQALEAYLKGRAFLARGSAADVQQATRAFEEAVALDPSFARAYVFLANGYQQGLLGVPVTREARAALDKALQLDPGLAPAQTLAGIFALYNDWDWETARQRLERAVHLDPANSAAVSYYAACFALLGQHEQAITLVKRAQELDPLSLNLNSDLGWYFFLARRYPEAEKVVRRSIELRPEDPQAYRLLLATQLQMGDTRNAAQSALRVMELEGAESVVVARARRKDALAVFRDWDISQSLRPDPRAGRIMPDAVALAYARAGQNEKAIEWLYRARHERTGWMIPFLAVDPQFEALRSDPRFRRLLRELRLPVPAES